MKTNIQMNNKRADTPCAILALAFGDKYFSWISLPAQTINNVALSTKDIIKLSDLIAERDHYEIKKTILSLMLNTKCSS
jgi:hypothetical protein